MSEFINKVSSVELPNLDEYGERIANKAELLDNLDSISDISIDLVVKLGKKKISLGDITELNVGDVLEVEKKPGHKVDIYFAEQHSGIGEVVLLDENFGIVISDIFSYPKLKGKKEEKKKSKFEIEDFVDDGEFDDDLDTIEFMDEGIDIDE